MQNLSDFLGVQIGLGQPVSAGFAVVGAVHNLNVQIFRASFGYIAHATGFSPHAPIASPGPNASESRAADHQMAWCPPKRNATKKKANKVKKR